MDTIIELYGDRAIENVLAPEVFHPKNVIYLCPAEIAQDTSIHEKLRDFFRSRGLDFEVSFRESSLYNADKIYRQMQKISETHPDCAIDITGGTDAALFAAGMFCHSHDIPAFTYSRKKHNFYDIHNAAFADQLPCTLSYSVEDFFHMAGGTMRKGRVDNQILSQYMPYFDPYFSVFMRFRRVWTDAVVYLQRASQGNRWDDFSLDVVSDYTVKGERGSRVSANPALLKAFEEIGFIHDLEIIEDEKVSFTFKDAQIRSWMRDNGSVLELYMYKACRDSGIFGDVVSSAVVDWDGSIGHDSVSNEIDVVAARGIVPLFISCKTCEIKTESLNELAILRERFGGKGAKAAIVTTERCNAAARHRAAKLGITVIDLEELSQDRTLERLHVVMKTKPATT